MEAMYRAVLEGFEDSDGVIREVKTEDLLLALIEDGPCGMLTESLESLLEDMYSE